MGGGGGGGELDATPSIRLRTLPRSRRHDLRIARTAFPERRAFGAAWDEYQRRLAATPESGSILCRRRAPRRSGCRAFRARSTHETLINARAHDATVVELRPTDRAWERVGTEKVCPPDIQIDSTLGFHCDPCGEQSGIDSERSHRRMRFEMVPSFRSGRDAAMLRSVTRPHASPTTLPVPADPRHHAGEGMTVVRSRVEPRR